MIKSFKKRLAFIKTAFIYAIKTPNAELENVVILLNFEKPAKNRIYLNIGTSSGGLGVLLGILVNFKIQVFPNYDSKKYIDFCIQGLSRELLKPERNTKRPVKRRIQKRRGNNANS